MLILNEEDMRKAVNPLEVMEAIEKSHVLFRKNDCYMPERYAATSKNKTMLYMPCFADGVIGTKILAEYPENPPKGLPYLSGIMILNNEETGTIEAIMNGQTLTALRTGAVGGVAVKHLSDVHSHSVGLVGCGVQGLHQLMYICKARNIQKINLYDQYAGKLEIFIEKLNKTMDNQSIEINICDNTTELVENSQIVVTATQATSPVLPDDAELLKGKCFVAIGSWQKHMREIPDAIWKVADNVYTELPFACEESGDIYQPLTKNIITKDRVKYMGDFLIQNKSIDFSTPQTTFYKSVGMAIFDLMAAKSIYNNAINMKLGTQISC